MVNKRIERALDKFKIHDYSIVLATEDTDFIARTNFTDREIIFSPKAQESKDIDKIILHEICHILSWPNTNHDERKFKRTAKRIGLTKRFAKARVRL